MMVSQTVFFASLVFAIVDGSEDAGEVWRHNILVLAPNPDDALTKAQALGTAHSETERFLGVEELLIVDGDIQDGVELVWQERLWTKDDVKKFLEKDALSHVLAENTNASRVGWYAGEITLLEVIEGNSGLEAHDLLIWRNTYLVQEPNSQLAFQRLEHIGQQEHDAGEHKSDGLNAEWKFLGVSMLRTIKEEPGDGRLLWRERLNSSPAQTILNMPSRNELGVFQWLGRSEPLA